MPTATRKRAGIVRRRRACVGVVTGLMILGASAHLAGGVGAVLGIDPGGGPNGTSYRVTVTCQQEPTLYGRPLTDSSPPTQVPLSITQNGPGVWTYDAVGEDFDAVYFASCGDTTEQGRFDTDAPRLYLGPVQNHSGTSPLPASRIEGTDCPDGTTAHVSIGVDGRSDAHTATIDQYGDWVVDLPALAGTKEMTIDAFCGSVAYARFNVTTTSTTPTSSSTSVDSTGTTAVGGPTTGTTAVATTATTEPPVQSTTPAAVPVGALPNAIAAVPALADPAFTG